MVKFIGFCAVFLLLSFFLVPAFYGVSDQRETIIATSDEPSAEDLNAIMPAAGEEEIIEDNAPIGNFDATIQPTEHPAL